MVDNDGDGDETAETWITHQELKARLAIRRVGRMAIRGAARDEILAEYPDLRERDIEIARQIATRNPSDDGWRGALPGVDLTRFRRRADDEREITVSELDRWVNDNNIPQSFEYSKGWWDYVELVRLFACRLGTDDVRVIGHYIVDTPPPCERLPMPAVAIVTPNVTFALRFDFGSWSLKHREICEWVLSVDRRSPYRGPLFGLIAEDHDLRAIGVDGLAPDHLFGSYRENQAKFSCLVRDEWDLATLLRMIAWEA
jgi:hypothetical protein